MISFNKGDKHIKYKLTNNTLHLSNGESKDQASKQEKKDRLKLEALKMTINGQ